MAASPEAAGAAARVIGVVAASLPAAHMGVSSAAYVGIDVGARRLHAVGVDEDLQVTSGALFDAGELGAVAAWATDARVIAIDAPDRLSSAAHVGDESVAPKFRVGRCAEVALARQRKLFVPWVTPLVVATGSWMAIGLELFRVLRTRGTAEVLETFPNAAFRVLADGAVLPKKDSVDGVQRRVALLHDAGVRARDLELWSHDSLDALVGALVAAQRARSQAVPVVCAEHAEGGGDGSALWLPGLHHAS